MTSDTAPWPPAPSSQITPKSLSCTLRILMCGGSTTSVLNADVSSASAVDAGLLPSLRMGVCLSASSMVGGTSAEEGGVATRVVASDSAGDASSGLRRSTTRVIC